MKKAIIPFAIFLMLTTVMSARIIKVDINGSGQFTTISAALNAAVNGDTIKVLPGVYDSAITISKDVVLMGSGYEVTKITSNSNPTINLNSGKVLWFSITSNIGDGIRLQGGLLTNCIVRGCAWNGITILKNSNAVVSNCIITQNGASGIWGEYNNSSSVYNCISVENSSSGFNETMLLSYSCGSNRYTQGNNGIINTTPGFTSSNDYHISPQSPCWDKGKPEILDPDGSRSDMGYFGGPDCPIYPVVTNVKIIPQTDGSIKIEATGVANY